MGQTRVYDEQGNAVCVTVVLAGPNRVVQCKSDQLDGYNAVQLGFDEQKEQRLTKPLMGHLRKHKVVAMKQLREFRDYDLEVKPGQELQVDVFQKGDMVDAIGITKGHGFQGVMKRHGFAGGPRSHGAKGFSRRPGAISSGSTPGTVPKGQPMPGHMGHVRRTTQNLQIIEVRKEDNVLLVKGSIPGATGDYVVIRNAKKTRKKAT